MWRWWVFLIKYEDTIVIGLELDKAILEKRGGRRVGSGCGFGY